MGILHRPSDFIGGYLKGMMKKQMGENMRTFYDYIRVQVLVT